LPIYLRLVWLYPLLRLYTLGPWNSGWGLATLLLGGALALWAALVGLTAAKLSVRAGLVIASYAALALAVCGLSSGAGVAAACYGVLACLILGPTRQSERGDPETEPVEAPARRGLPSVFALALPWLVSGAVPFTAPFVAAWMAVGAATAGGVIALAAVAWLAVLLNALPAVLWPASASRGRALAAAVGLVVGVGAPVVIAATIQPAIEQLQGGLTPYGDVNIWPWVGITMLDAAKGQVAVLPSVAGALLMLVLAALVYLVARFWQTMRSAPPANSGPGEPSDGERLAQQEGVGQPSADRQKRDYTRLLSFLRREVPWLGGEDEPREEPRGDAQ
jgi:hypothetical protein